MTAQYVHLQKHEALSNTSINSLKVLISSTHVKKATPTPPPTAPLSPPCTDNTGATRLRPQQYLLRLLVGLSDTLPQLVIISLGGHLCAGRGRAWRRSGGKSYLPLHLWRTAVAAGGVCAAPPRPPPRPRLLLRTLTAIPPMLLPLFPVSTSRYISRGWQTPWITEKWTIKKKNLWDAPAYTLSEAC